MARIDSHNTLVSVIVLFFVGQFPTLEQTSPRACRCVVDAYQHSPHHQDVATPVHRGGHSTLYLTRAFRRQSHVYPHRDDDAVIMMIAIVPPMATTVIVPRNIAVPTCSSSPPSRQQDCTNPVTMSSIRFWHRFLPPIRATLSRGYHPNPTLCHLRAPFSGLILLVLWNCPHAFISRCHHHRGTTPQIVTPLLLGPV